MHVILNLFLGINQPTMFVHRVAHSGHKRSLVKEERHKGNVQLSFLIFMKMRVILKLLMLNNFCSSIGKLGSK